MQGSPSRKLEVAFVANSSTQKVVANMEVDREYNACKALDPQIDNEDDVQHSSRHYEINEQELQTQMGLGGLHGCNDWARRTGRSGLVAALYGRGGLADGWIRKSGRGGLQNPGRGGLGQTRRVGPDGADGADLGGRGRLEDWRLANAAAWIGRTAANGADWGKRGKVGRTGADGQSAGRGGQGELGQMRPAAADWGGLGRTGRRGAYWVELGGA